MQCSAGQGKSHRIFRAVLAAHARSCERLSRGSNALTSDQRGGRGDASMRLSKRLTRPMWRERLAAWLVAPWRPITIKECFDFAGLPSTYGHLDRANHKAPADAATVSRLRATGRSCSESERTEGSVRLGILQRRLWSHAKPLGFEQISGRLVRGIGRGARCGAVGSGAR